MLIYSRVDLYMSHTICAKRCIMEQMNNIEGAYTAVVDAHKEYEVLNNEYRALMNSSHGYQIVDESATTLVKTTTGAPGYLCDGTFYNERGALTAGLIEKITAVKPDELKEAEKVLQGATIAYNTLCSEMILPYQFKATKTRSSSGNAGEAGAGKCAEVLAQIRAIDNNAVVNFNGRRVYGTIGKGIAFDYDIYGVSFIDSLRAKVS